LFHVEKQLFNYIDGMQVYDVQHTRYTVNNKYITLFEVFVIKSVFGLCVWGGSLYLTNINYVIFTSHFTINICQCVCHWRFVYVCDSEKTIFEWWSNKIILIGYWRPDTNQYRSKTKPCFTEAQLAPICCIVARVNHCRNWIINIIAKQTMPRMESNTFVVTWSVDRRVACVYAVPVSSRIPVLNTFCFGMSSRPVRLYAHIFVL
jgi:hypothetical protein